MSTQVLIRIATLSQGINSLECPTVTVEGRNCQVSIQSVKIVIVYVAIMSQSDQPVSIYVRLAKTSNGM